MDHQCFSILLAAISKRAAKDSFPAREIETLTAYPLGVVLRCVELGDTRALKKWIGEAKTECSSDEQSDRIVTAAEYILGRWSEIERHHGDGALLDFKHCLKHSPAAVIGHELINNARRFQETKSREPGDPLWALRQAA